MVQRLSALRQELDLSFVRDLVRDLYAPWGRPGVDPEVSRRYQKPKFGERLTVMISILAGNWQLAHSLHFKASIHG